jgi:hypothetical protein
MKEEYKASETTMEDVCNHEWHYLLNITNDEGVIIYKFACTKCDEFKNIQEIN